MLWLHQLYIIFILIITSTVSSAVFHRRDFGPRRIKRQGVSLGAIIDGALNLVRPMIDTSKPLQDDTKIPKQLTAETVSYREAEILGSPRYSSLQDVPICRSNSAICSFISCTARNFKSDQSFANLNLAAQVLADTKLRKGISKDPDALLAVCHEQGLSKPECKLFAKGFQLVDKLFTTIESKDSKGHETQTYTEEDPIEEADAPPIPIRPRNPENDTPLMGSRTWSSHPKPIEPIVNNPVAPFGNLPTLPPLFFTLPTLPTLPPFIPPEQVFMETSSSAKPQMHSDNDILQIPFTAPLQVFPSFARFQRSVNMGSIDFDDESDQLVREKRSDYYDQVGKETSRDEWSNSLTQKGRERNILRGMVYDDHNRISNPSRWSNPSEKAYRKQNSYENCFKYLDHSELRLFK